MVISKGVEVESCGEIINMVETIISNMILDYFIVFGVYSQPLF